MAKESRRIVSSPVLVIELAMVVMALFFGTGCAQEIDGPEGTGGVQGSAGGQGAAAQGPPLTGQMNCPAGFASCATGCKAIQTDSTNCGGCGITCSATEVCDQGKCKARAQGCSAGTAECNGGCVDLMSSNAHCGTCGFPCGADQTCSGGKCVCLGGKTLCGSTCVDLSNDVGNCGLCGKTCAEGMTCQQGMCTCPAGKVECAGRCVDLQTDIANCGMCGKTCSSDQVCVLGMCGCGGEKTDCGGQCTDTKTDDRNCGGCGKPCSLGQGCSNGMCGGGGTAREDGCMGLAQNLTVSQIAVYQTVEIPIMKDGQAVEPAARNTDVVAGREALVRVFVSAGPGFTERELSARLFVENGTEVKMYYGKGTLKGSSQAGDLSTTLQIDLPKDALTTESNYALEVVECGAPPAGGAVQAPRFPASGGSALGARAAGKLRVRVIPMQVNSMLPDTSEAALSVYKKRLLALYPISDVEITVGEPYTFPNATDWAGNLDRLRQKRRADAPDPDVYYYGLLKTAASLREFCGSGCTTGIGYVTSSAGANQAAQRVALGIGYADGPSADTMAHEIAHNHGRAHAPCGNGISGVDANYPYMGGRIGVYGYDREQKRLVPPDRTDLMGYCNNKWLSDYTYDALLARVTAVSAARSAYYPADLAQPWNVLLLDENGPRWGEPITEPDVPAGEPEPAEILDVYGRVIAIETVFRTEISDIGAFSFEVPAPKPGWHSIRVVGASPLAY